MFQFIIGASGAGKTHMVYEKIIAEAVADPEKQYYVVIPEQSSLEAQKLLVKLHPRKSIMNIDALSFMRLAHKVFAERADSGRVMLDDAGKTLVVKRVLKEHAAELRYFAANAGRRGFCVEMKSVISELLQYGIDADKLQKMIDLSKANTSKNQLLTKKLEDVAVCFSGFKEFIAEKFIAPEEIYDLLADAVPDSTSLKKATVVLDGYTGFTPSQYRLLEALFKTCEKVYITITMDPADYGKTMDKHGLFHLSGKTILKLREIAAEAGCEELEPLFAGAKGELPRFKDSPGMAAFEKGLFSGVRARKEAPKGAPCPIELRSAVNPAEEVKALCCEIKAAVGKGLRYRDIAVITGDMEGYGPLLQREFERAGIPAFMDYRRKILADPVVELLRALVELPVTGFSYDGVMHLVRTTLFGIDDLSADDLDNYLVATGIRGKSSWKKEFRKTFKKPYTPDLESLNKTREQIINRVDAVTEVLEKESTVSAKIEALRAFLEAEKLDERLEKLIEETYEAPYTDELGLRQRSTELTQEFEQIHGLIEEIFFRMQNLLGDEIIPLKDFAELLELGYSEVKVGLLPAAMDCMLVGDVERSRLGNIKKLFFIGVNDGIIPAAAKRGGIISDADRMFFEEQGIDLSPTMREKAYTGEFYLYQNLTKPAESLYVSYSEKSSKDETLNPSYLVGVFKRMYEYAGLKAVPASEMEIPEYVLASDGGNSAMRNSLRELRAALEQGLDPTDIVNEAMMLGAALNIGEAERREILKAAFYRNAGQKISDELAERLYGDPAYSISRLEKFAGCNFAHFLKYGLRLEPRKEYEIKSFDVGNICHDAMEACSRKVREDGLKFAELTPEQCAQLADWSSTTTMAEYENGILLESSRNEHIAGLLRDVVERTLKATAFQLKDSSFEPAWFEEPFKMQENGVTLGGRFDRIDLCFKDDMCLVKVVDYKSSEHKVEEEKMRAGLQLQLGVYANAAEKLIKDNYPNKKYLPAAILYYELKDPVVEECEDPEKKICSQLRPEGRVNADTEALISLDEGFKGDDGKSLKPGFSSNKIRVGLKAGGEFSNGSRVWTTEQFEEYAGILRNKVTEFVGQIKNGEADANPVRYKGSSNCTYCDYRDICAFGSLNGKRERIVGNYEEEGEGEEE